MKKYCNWRKVSNVSSWWFLSSARQIFLLKLLAFNLFQFNIQMHAPYILLKSYKDPIKDNINTDSYVSNYHFGIFYIMILKLILFFYIFAVIEGEYSIRNKGPHNSFQSLSLIFCLRNTYVPCNMDYNSDPFEMLASDFAKFQILYGITRDIFHQNLLI